MPAIINPVITDAGLTAAVDADLNMIQVAITHVAIGSAGYTPSGAETGMVDRRETVSIASGAVSVGGSLTVSVLFPSYAGTPYDAKEIGFYIGDPSAGGILFAVYSSTAASGFVFRSSLDFIAQFSLGLTRVPSGSVTVSIDPSAAVLHALIQDHKDEVDPHPNYTTESEVLDLARPAGMICAFASTSAPPGFLKCNGAAVSRTAYARLFARIGTAFGGGDGSTTFNLPDFRGEFPRFLDDGRGIDAGRVIGSAQGDLIRSHTHTGATTIEGSHIHGNFAEAGFDNRNVGQGTRITFDDGFSYNNNNVSMWAGAHQHWFTTDATGGSETRPRNVALLACISF